MNDPMGTPMPDAPKKNNTPLIIGIVVAVVLALSASAGAEPRAADKTLSPYFVVEGGAPGLHFYTLNRAKATLAVIERMR